MVIEHAVELTQRQEQVAHGLSRHLGIKEIAHELDISMSAVSKHIAGLKQKLGATTHAEIVAAWLLQAPKNREAEGVEKGACRFSHLPGTTTLPPRFVSADPGLLSFSDGADYPPLWLQPRDVRVVPRWLDGTHATAARLAVIGGGIFGLVSVLVLSLSAMNSVSDLVEDAPPNLALEHKSAG